MHAFNSPILFLHHNIFSNKTVFFWKQLLSFWALKNSSPKRFWIFPSKISTLEFFLCTLVDLPVSFQKICSEQLFCKNLSVELVMRCAIWYQLYNLKSVKNTHGRVLILVKLQAVACNFIKINTLP